MSVTQAPASPAEAEWDARQARWTHGWRRLVLPVIPLVYLLYVAAAVAANSRGAAAVAGYVILAVFAACWLAIIQPLVHERPAAFWVTYTALWALLAAELPFSRGAGFTMAVFITIVSVASWERKSWPVVVFLAAAALVVPVVIPFWHVSLSGSVDMVTPVAIPIVAVALFASLEVVRSNQALAQARADLARLAAENERIRIARDLHDLLGHSLTTITVKAGLASRISESEPAAARQEMTDVEKLARQALSDVRATISSYRDVTLASELAVGRELLRAAGISAELPRAVDVVDPAHQELFGWVVREGLTNVVRHARASWCAVRLSRAGVEIVDDGIGSRAPAGNGLSGLQERVAAAGGVVDAGPRQPHGWRLAVSLATPASLSPSGAS